MYIFELLYKITTDIIKKYKNKSQKQETEIEQNENDEKCEHVFLPIDSTKEILACSKCGMLIKTKNLKIETNTNTTN